VPGKLQAELKQTRPFARIGEEAVLNVMRTAEVIERALSDFLKGFDLSPVQYNVLRILRGAEPAGVTCSQIGERLLTHDPDITRLLDRMESRGWIVRERSKEDRRAVITRISEAGMQLVNRIDQPIEAMSQSKMGRFGHDDLAALIATLERMREAFESEEITSEERNTK
jgi:DNA-binding MarR family transcriptional regulator